ncbi:MAG: hypothetical protein ACETWG_06390 [Candidatus Neomarinimicrobiota bacterium]
MPMTTLALVNTILPSLIIYAVITYSIIITGMVFAVTAIYLIAE